MKEKMTFEEFGKEVAERIKEWLPDQYCDAEVLVKSIMKNNNLIMTGLTITCRDSNISPTIYLEQFYEKYQEGMELPAILEKIAEVRVQNNVAENFDMTDITDFEKCRHKILPRLVSAEWNEKMLEELPHVILEDLAVIFYIDLGNHDEGEMTVKVTNAMRVLWKISTEELYDLAVKNLAVSHAGTLTSLVDVLYKIIMKSDQHGEGEEYAEMKEILKADEEDKIYVLSNKNNFQGAAMILDQSIMEQATEILGDEFYVLPSSVHELLLVPRIYGSKQEELRSMVCEVNTSTVMADEQLSNNVYTYSLENGLRIA